VRLSEVARLPSFAVLGPGFGTQDLGVLCDLHREDRAPSLVYVPYEGSAASAVKCGGSPLIGVEIDVPAPSIAWTLSSPNHSRAVEEIREAIAAGDVYQVNLTVRASLPPVPGEALLAALCRHAVPRFAAWVRLPDGAEFVSASPELFFEIRGSQIRSQPMKGTAAAERAAALASSPKDTAELAMITDLIRNDLTSICESRSVRVDSERRLIELPYAVQAVSEVSGRLLRGTTLATVLDALHPGGSITGAPKSAARRMIASLEEGPRGAYCGTLGYVQGDRSVFSLLIRTAEKTTNGWSYGVGGGIVWDSDAAQEMEEIHVKLGALA
jgi:anthranilate/para-aminobenzoate synthase component I